MEIKPRICSDWKSIISNSIKFENNNFVNVNNSTTADESQQNVIFYTESSYSGNWNENFGMQGEYGEYSFPNGIIYKGKFKNNMFHGQGVLYFPNGQLIKGIWENGKCKQRKYYFNDRLKFKDTEWKYCIKSDRRYATCIFNGLLPIGEHYITKDRPMRVIPNGCYDTGNGFYNPKKKCILCPYTFEKILEIPTSVKEKWIFRNCRKALDILQ